METLYDLLGALPRDDAEGLRAAFRRAVKGAHPDLNPGDPDAGLKFRQIVRANDILADVEQRAVYDHLLELARLEQAQASRHVVADTIYKVASAVIALTAAVTAAAGLYLLVMNLPGSVFPSVNGARIATGDQAAAITAALRTEPAVASAPAAPAETSAAPGNPPAATPWPSAAAATPPPRIGPPLDISPKGASFLRAPADIARARRIERARRAAAPARARKRRLARAATDSRAKAARRRRTARVALWRRE